MKFICEVPEILNIPVDYWISYNIFTHIFIVTLYVWLSSKCEEINPEKETIVSRFWLEWLWFGGFGVTACCSILTVAHDSKRMIANEHVKRISGGISFSAWYGTLSLVFLLPSYEAFRCHDNTGARKYIFQTDKLNWLHTHVFVNCNKIAFYCYGYAFFRGGLWMKWVSFSFQPQYWVTPHICEAWLAVIFW